jgi:uncharacterized membrane protein
MLMKAFQANIFPYLIQIGGILFVFTICQHGYSLLRSSNWQQFIDKFKAALVAYAIVRGAFAILSFIDNVIGSMK